MIRFTTFFFCSLLSVNAFAQEADSPQEPPGFETPNQALQAYLRGAAIKDFGLMLSTLTQESKTQIICLTIYSAVHLGDRDPEMLDVIRATGFPLDKVLENANEIDEDEINAQVLAIKNPGKLMKDIYERHILLAKRLGEQLETNPEAEPQPTEQEILRIVGTVEIVDLNFTDDSATGTVQMPDAAREILGKIPESITFQRVGNRWFFHVDL